jgi:hypothetical protein
LSFAVTGLSSTVIGLVFIVSVMAEAGPRFIAALFLFSRN